MTAQLTVEQAALREAIRIVDKFRWPEGVSLSNKIESDDLVSYRMWGERISVQQLTVLMTALRVKQSQPFRWYEGRKGRGLTVAGDAVWTRNLGNSELRVSIDLLLTGSIMLRIATPSLEA